MSEIEVSLVLDLRANWISKVQCLHTTPFDTRADEVVFPTMSNIEGRLRLAFNDLLCQNAWKTYAIRRKCKACNFNGQLQLSNGRVLGEASASLLNKDHNEGGLTPS